MEQEPQETGHDIGAEARNEARETTDVNSRAVLKFAAALAVGIVVSMALMWAVVKGWERYQLGPGRSEKRAKGAPEEGAPPPPPRLLSGGGLRVSPEALSDDPLIQKEIGGRGVNLELEPPDRYREIYDQIKQRELSSYGPLRRTPGEYHIPIEVAKRQLVENGGRLSIATERPGSGPGRAAGPPPSPPHGAEQGTGQSPEGYESLPTAASSGRAYEQIKP
jgi:hypothetical protein